MREGGLAEMERKNIAKSKLLYDFLDASAFFKRRGQGSQTQESSSRHSAER
jgi:phosphoserine aminotransferase